jgi:hypothetical protein
MQTLPPVPPWKRKKKSGKPAQKMTLEQKMRARARAEAAGRPYPNLIDNMAVIREDNKTGDAGK